MMTSAGKANYVLAIDLGSGGPKVALISDRDEIIEFAYEPTSTRLLPDGGIEQDPSQWRQAIGQHQEFVTSRLIPVEGRVD